VKILIAPYPAKLPSGAKSAKEYPHWPELVTMLKANEHHIIQIGIQGEQRIEGVDEFRIGLPLTRIRDLVGECDVWVSVDSFLPHLCAYYKLKNGVVLWGKSSPYIFGYPENENLFVSEKNFRQFQYCDWHNEPHDPSVFVPARQAVWAVERILTAPLRLLAASQQSNKTTNDRHVHKSLPSRISSFEVAGNIKGK